MKRTSTQSRTAHCEIFYAMAYTVVDILFSLTFFGVWQYYCKEKVSSLFCSVVKSQIVCDICGTFVGPSSTTHSSSIAEHSSTITFQQNLISQDSLDPAFHVKPELVNAQLLHISISVSQSLKITKKCLNLTLIFN